MWLTPNAKNPLVFAILLLLSVVALGCASQRTFETPDTAVTSLVDALRGNEKAVLSDILGPDADDLLFSGDPNVDRTTVNRFLSAYDQKHDLITNEDESVTLCVGQQDWPLPIPLVQNAKNKWYFDTAAGKDEILNRRIGRDELDTIQTCLAIVDAQNEYARMDPQKMGVPCYAQKFLSDPGKKNGLYWPTKEAEPESPLGDLVGEAQEQGYDFSRPVRGPRPYHGYYYRILRGQGPDAPGGARDYIVNGKMIGGFAIIATPANYGNTGIMTFIVNQDGKVYQRDLGPDSAKVASKITLFNPDSTWKPVESLFISQATTEPAKP